MYCKFGNFCEGFIFAKFRENKTIAKWLNYPVVSCIRKPCPIHEFLMMQIDLLWLFTKIKFSQKFLNLQYRQKKGAQWLSGRMLDSRQRGRGFEPHRRHCVVSLSKNIYPSLVHTGLTQEDLSLHN